MGAMVGLEEVQQRLGELIRKLHPGEELFIHDEDGHIVARLVAMPRRSGEPIQLGTMKGTVLYMAPDFDAPLEFKESME